MKELDFDEFAPEMLAFLEAYRSAEKTKKTAKAAAAATKQGSLSGTPNSGKTPSGTDANGKTTDDLSDDEDEDDVYDNSTNGGVDTSITGFIEESSSNKRSRPEEDETDSEGGDDEVHGKTASKRTKDLDHELVNENE